MAELEYRTAAVAEVRHPERLIDIIAVPYDEETRVLHQGRWITETIAPGTFSGVSGEIRVNQAHDLERPIGRVTHLHPNDPRGLRAEVRIAATTAGDDVLALADEDLVGASIGFAPLPGGESYTPDRLARRITKAFLGHIALTGNPAYTGAKVLAVRAAADPPPTERVGTPNLDRILAERDSQRLGLTL